jgi:hypothetical protein
MSDTKNFSLSDATTTYGGNDNASAQHVDGGKARRSRSRSKGKGKKKVTKKSGRRRSRSKAAM